MTIVRKALLAGTVAAAAMTTASAGYAACASSGQVSYEHSNTKSVIREEHEQTRDAIITSIEEMTQTLIETLTMQSEENSSYLDKQIEADKRIADAEQQNATDRMRQEFRAEAESGKFDPNPFTCLLDDLFGGSGGGGSAPPSGGDDVVNTAMSAISGSDPAVQAGGTALARSVVEAREEFAGFQGSSNATTDWSIPLQNPTINLEDEQTARLVDRIVRNSIDPTPPRPVTDEEMETPAGMSRAADREKTIARQRAAGEVMAMTLNMRTPVLDDSDGTYQAIAENSAYNRPVPDKLSELQQLDIRTVSHYAPAGERSEALKSMNDTAWLAEIHKIMSINTRINYIRLELENRNAIVNSLMLAAMSEGQG